MSEKSQRRVIVLLAVLCLLSVCVFLQIDSQFDSTLLFTPRFHIDNSSLGGFLVDTIGCRIADLDPFDDSIKEFIYTEDHILCDEEGLSLVESNLTSLYVNRAAFGKYNITDDDIISCCFMPFWRVQVEGNTYSQDVDEKYRFANACVPFESEVNPEAEFVKVQCSLLSNVIYTDYHAFVPIKKQVEDRCTNKTISKNAVSVLVIGVDAVSRLNLYRQMPRTLSFIKENMNVVELLGYNKIDDNTFPNLVPVLLGLTVDELKLACWPTSETVFDDCPLIWKNYSASGYRTMFAEDASWMGTFSYTRRGFKVQPTDYYTRIFNKLSEDDIGYEKRLNAKLCTGSRLSSEVLLNYASKFATAMLNKLSFGFVWGASLSHDYLNLPKFGDKYYEKFFRRLTNLDVFNNTVLVFMSDHGIRWGGIRSTYQGYLEERLPFLFIGYPDWFKRKYVTAIGNLRKNAHRLTTPFDLHETLNDLLKLDDLEQEALKERSEHLNNLKLKPRGISLFLPVQESRTCISAGIAAHWCTCHQGFSVSVNNTIVIQSVTYLMTYINDLLTPFPQCEELSLDEIMSARLEKPTHLAHTDIKTSDAGIEDYTLTIQTMPGGAIFEATVRYNANRKLFSLAGAISRINLYGNQSSCVSYFRTKLYCYCRNQK